MPTSLTSFAAERGLRVARSLARDQALAVSRRQLYAAGVPRWLVARELRAERWQRGGRQTVVLHNGPLGVGTQRWLAVLELGPRAALSGVTGLQEAGITALTDTEVHVIVPRGARPTRRRGVVVHESRRWRAEDISAEGLPQTKPAVSAVLGALWARTDREATFLLVLAVQAGLTTPALLAEVLDTVRRHRRRSVLWAAIDELAGGVRSLGELDVARAMRSRGLPEPTRQAVRRRPDGTIYLDVEYAELGLVIEVDGLQHQLPWAVLADTVRDLRLAAEGSTVLRIPLMAWRLDEERVLDTLTEVFVARGWVPQAA